MIRKFIPILGFVIITFIFFWQFLFKGLLPIPTDTVVGLYYPYRDIYSSTNPNGLPFKNFLITDPVRQQYPWRNLTINSYKNLEVPTWNSYSFSGTPNLANFQSAAFYPLNVLLFIFSFQIGWSILILLSPLLAGIFLYLYLRNLKLDEYSSFLGGVIFGFSGFFVTWLEWGTILHTALWLPLILLCIDKISNEINKKRELFLWTLILVGSYAFSFFAGHLQTFFYLAIFSFVYLIFRVWQSKNKIKLFLVFLIGLGFTAIIIIPQLFPTLKFIFISGRALDQLNFQNEGWFIPTKQLIQFIVPDFFGNPTTLNYWGEWNYGELTGYIGLIGIILSLFAVLFRRDKKVLFFFGAFIFSLIFAVSNPISKLPFILNLPFLSTAQPTRLLFIIDFSLSVLAALGLNYLILKGKLKQILIPILIVGLLLATLFLFVLMGANGVTDLVNLMIAKRNLYLPIAIYLSSSLILILYVLLKKKFKNYILLALILLAILELFRFSWKFNTFSKKEYLYPETQITKFLQSNLGNYRSATTDPRIMAPNFFIMHGIRSVEGYDPLYIQRYAQLIAAINRNKADINPPFGFNRIIRIDNFSSNLVDLLGIKYVISLSDINTKGFNEVFEEGQTKIYENEEVLPRVFFAKNVRVAKNDKDAIKMMFDKDFKPIDDAIVEENVGGEFLQGKANILNYSDNKIIINTQNKSLGFLILTDTYYPTWHVKINGKESKIYRADFNFQGVLVPAGDNTIEFSNKLL